MLEVAAALMLVPLTLFLPGLACFDLCFSRTHRTALEVFALRVLLSALLTTVTALALADSGCFSLLRVVVLLALGSAAAVFLRLIRRRAVILTGPVRDPDAWLLLPLLGVAALVFLRPHEYLYGGWDPAVYLQTAANIAATGRINFHDSLLAGMDGGTRTVFLAHKGWAEVMSGFRVINAAEGFISPQFQHVYSCWVALFYSAGGLPAALRVNALFGVLSVLAFYLAARDLFEERTTALMATLLLAGNVVQIWFARFSTAEIVAQYFVWSGIGLLVRHLRGASDGAGLLGGCCLGAAWLTHISTWFLAVPLLAVVLYRMTAGEARRDLPVTVTLAVCGGLAVLQNQLVSLSYIDLVRYARALASLHPLRLAAVAVLAALVLGWARRDHAARLQRLLGHPAARAALAFVIVGLTLYALLLRPRLVPVSHAAAVLEGDSLKRLLSNALSVRDMAKLFTPLGLGLAIAGAAWMVWRDLTRVRAPVFVMLAAVTVLVLYDRQVEPFYMFGARRFLIVVIPSLCLAMAYILSAVWRASRRMGRAVATACLAAVLLVPAAGGRQVVITRDYRGLTAFCRQVASLLPGDGRDRRVLLCDHEGLAAALRFFARENAFVIHARDDQRIRLLARQIAAWQKEGRTVFYLSEDVRPYAREWKLTETGRAHFASSRLERAPRFFPVERVRHEASPRLFRLTQAD